MFSFLFRRNKIDVIYLHIGFHKTGSSSIQQSLYENRRKLADHGISLICLSKYKRDMDKGNAMYLVRRPKRLVKKLQQSQSVAVISSEDMSWWDDGKIVNLKKVLSRFSPNIKIIAYLRNHDEYAVSMKQQGAKASHIAKIFGHSDSLLPELNERVLYQVNYYNNLKKWSNHFGNDNLMITTFDYLKANNISLLDNFFGKIGAASIDLKRLPRRNESIDYYWQKLLHNHQALLWASKAVRNAMLPELIELSDSSEKKTISRDASLQFRERFAEDIEKLKEFPATEILFNQFYPQENTFVYQDEKYQKTKALFLDLLKKTTASLFLERTLGRDDLEAVICQMAHVSREDAISLCDMIATKESDRIKQKVRW